MKLTPETIDDLVALVQTKFLTFGGGLIRDSNNPISHAMKDNPASFAMGVDCRKVVEFVLEQAEKMPRRKRGRK